MDEVHIIVCDLGNGLAYYASTEHRYEGHDAECGCIAPLEASQDMGAAISFPSWSTAVRYAWQMGMREWLEQQQGGYRSHFVTWILDESEGA